MNPYFTIIIPHYNNPRYLKRLLLSIPYREDIEIIVVDDCSSEYVHELELLKNEFPLVIWRSTLLNGGAGKARNIGLREANGSYVLFADSDDFFLPTFSEILDEYKNKSFDITYFPVISLETENLYPAKRAYGHNEKILNAIINKDSNLFKFASTVPWGKIINLSFIREKGVVFQESNISNDVYFSTQVDIHARKCLIDNRVLYCVTERINSVSKITSIEKANTRLIIDINRIKTLQDHKIKIDIPIEHLIDSLIVISNDSDNNNYASAIESLNAIGLSKKKILKSIFIYKIKKRIGNSIRRIIPKSLKNKILLLLS